MECALTLAMGQAPAGVLTAETGQHRIGGVHLNRDRPVRDRASAGQRHAPESAQADLGDQPARLKSSRTGDSGVDDSGAVGEPVETDAQHLGIVEQRLDDQASAQVEAMAPRRMGGINGLWVSVRVHAACVFSASGACVVGTPRERKMAAARWRSRRSTRTASLPSA